MKATITATANEETKTFDIVKTWDDGTSVTYRTAGITEQEFEDMEYNTQGDWQDFLKNDGSYHLLK